jgi:acetyl-CoA decarbonylase/synthase complex subunit gamma
MALSGIQIYKLLPQTNCKECGFPTCLAFAMKLAAQQVELATCPYVSDEAKGLLEAAASPPVRLITLKSNGHQIEVGNETVMFRHEKTFVHKPGIFVRVRDSQSPDEIQALVAEADAYSVEYVGIKLNLDGFAVEGESGNASTFAQAIESVRSATRRPLILISLDPAVMEAGLGVLGDEQPLIYAANADNWQAMAGLAKTRTAPLAVVADTLDGLATLTEQLKEAGVEDLVLDPANRQMHASLLANTQIRRAALKANFRPLGYPIISFPAFGAQEACHETVLACQAIAKYGGFVVIEHADPQNVYPLLVLRENIFTDPQKPIQVSPGLYEINAPGPNDPVLVTTNFSITYFSVANEVDGSGLPAWLLVTDAEGMSVLTAWAAGKFDAERIAKSVKTFEVGTKVDKKRIVLPGLVAVLSGELEEELPDWQIMVGPREAVDIPGYYKQVLAA